MAEDYQCDPQNRERFRHASSSDATHVDRFKAEIRAHLADHFLCLGVITSNVCMNQKSAQISITYKDRPFGR